MAGDASELAGPTAEDQWAAHCCNPSWCLRLNWARAARNMTKRSSGSRKQRLDRLKGSSMKGSADTGKGRADADPW